MTGGCEKMIAMRRIPVKNPLIKSYIIPTSSYNRLTVKLYNLMFLSIVFDYPESPEWLCDNWDFALPASELY